MRPAAAAPHAESEFAPIRNLATDIETALERAHAIFGDAVEIAQAKHTALLKFETRSDEVTTGQRHRLIELGEELRVVADLQISQPFAAELVELGHDEAQREVVATVAGKIVFEVQTDTNVVRPPT